MLMEMLFDVRKLAPLLVIPLFTQCGPGSAPPTNTVTGPFDSRGNYIEDWVDQPDKWYRPPPPGSKPKPQRVAKKEEQPPQIPVVDVRPTADSVVVKPKPTPPKPKPKPKPKPQFVFHKVQRGDTLSGLSRRYGTSISKIKSANGISGTIIRLGQTLKIPK